MSDERMSVKRTRRFEVEVYATAQELEDAMARVMAALDDLSPTCGTADMDYRRRGQ